MGITNSGGLGIPFSYLQPLYVTLLDDDGNLNGQVADTLEITLSNLENGDSETVLLTESGISTGEFRNSAPFPTGSGIGIPENGTFEGQGRERIQMTYQDPQDPSDMISIVDFDISPTVYDFGDDGVSDGDAQILDVTITNDSSVPLSFTEISLGGAGGGGASALARTAASFTFAAAPDTSPLGPGESRVVQIAFDPQSTGPLDDELFVDTNNPIRPSFTVPLSGFGVLPPTANGIADVSVNEDAADTVIGLFAAFDDNEDPDADLVFSVTGNTNTALFDAVSIDGGTGNLTLDYKLNANGTGDLTVRATDTDGLFTETTFNVEVLPVNDPPVAVDDTPETDEETALVYDVRTNDSDPDGDDLTVTAVTTPSHGTASIDGSGNVVYTPAQDYFGPDTFDYTLSDGNGETDTGTVSVTVNNVNDDPVASIDDPVQSTIQVTETDSVSFSGSATDVDGDSLTFTWDFGDGPSDVGPDVTHQFEPGEYFVTLTVDDGHGGSDSVVVVVTVIGGAGDDDLYLLKGAFQVNWAKHAGGVNADSLSLAGILNKAGLPLALPGGSSVTVFVNDEAVGGGALALDSRGTGAGEAGGAKFTFKLSAKNGKYSYKLSKADLRTALSNVPNETVSGAVADIKVELVFNIPGMATPDLLGTFSFVQSTAQDKASKGKYAFKNNASMSGVFKATKMKVNESKAGGAHSIAARGVIAASGGKPVVITGDVVIEIGTASSTTITDGTLTQSGAGATSVFTLPKGAGPAAVTSFGIDNAKKSWKLDLSDLHALETDIPLSTDPETRHLLTVRITATTSFGDLTFETEIEIARKAGSTSWK